ncbi:unnamed protein product [Paramecium octaurelia]|uniref:Uncharacterized protein n=1 Tax=Paramecium octaurelia TaxID=43137 RepID=A0A8S1UYA1_PAROT|nr:unnamed protein product [Paramecium octaurelia]
MLNCGRPLEISRSTLIAKDIDNDTNAESQILSRMHRDSCNLRKMGQIQCHYNKAEDPCYWTRTACIKNHAITLLIQLALQRIAIHIWLDVLQIIHKCKIKVCQDLTFATDALCKQAIDSCIINGTIVSKEEYAFKLSVKPDVSYLPQVSNANRYQLCQWIKFSTSPTYNFKVLRFKINKLYTSCTDASTITHQDCQIFSSRCTKSKTTECIALGSHFMGRMFPQWQGCLIIINIHLEKLQPMFFALKILLLVVAETYYVRFDRYKPCNMIFIIVYLHIGWNYMFTKIACSLYIFLHNSSWI